MPFPFDRVEHHLQGAWGPITDHRSRFLALGEYHGQFNMTALALRTSDFANGVSRLHGDVTRTMWEPLLQRARSYRSAPTENRSPTACTCRRGSRSKWRSSSSAISAQTGANRQDDPEFWNGVFNISDQELWNARTALKRFLFTFIRQRARDRWAQENVSAAAVVAAGPLLDPGALTIGFARRFTAYKRPELIFRDPERLIRLLSAQRRHVQIVFAGKAHPADDAGKASSAADLSPRDRPRVRRAHRVRRRLRSARRAFPDSGLRRLAEYAPQSRSKRAGRAA